MEINTQIFDSASRDPVRLKKNLFAKSRAIIFQSWVKIYSRVHLDSVLIQKNYTKLYKKRDWAEKRVYR